MAIGKAISHLDSRLGIASIPFAMTGGFLEMPFSIIAVWYNLWNKITLKSPLVNEYFHIRRKKAILIKISSINKMETKNGIKTFNAKTRKDWRKWLEKNGESEKSVWLILYHKISKTPSIYYPEAVEEALCFGWIDSKPHKRDHESYYQFFSVRKPKSKWSKVNKKSVSRLIEAGLMTQRGMEMIELAKQTGTWDALTTVDNLEVPNDLAKAFSKSKIAFKNWQLFPPSTKKGILEWILNAKRIETRNKRIEETVWLAAQNIRANQYRPS